MPSSDAPPRRQRAVTAERHTAILEAALATFGSKGYAGGSLQDVAAQVGMTHAGVLHHFGSKQALLLAVLEHRDQSEVAVLPEHHMPAGRALFDHLIETARRNVERPGIVQAYAVLSAEAATDDHPAADYFASRYAVLRRELGEALEAMAEDEGVRLAEHAAEDAAAAVLGVMDGLQVQWLLAPDRVDLARATARAIEGILAGALAEGRPQDT